ncbi:MAG: TerC family protein [Anaerolineae bacterium]|nr:TerC family protein [Anaerolineae bacterium]
MFGTDWQLWVAFNVVVLAMLALDLGVLHRKAHAVRLREAAIWSAVWICLSLAFNGVVYLWRGPEAGLQFLTGYLIEKSLSIDNIFVFVLIFSYFSVPATYQHRVLFWGVLGALVMRAILIAAGVVLIEKFHWIIYIFGAFLIFTGWRMARHQEIELHPEANPVVRLARRFIPIHPHYEGQSFFIRQGGRLLATPLLLVLLIVESTDLVFAVDSIPAVLAISTDPFIVYTSNVFAILGLRALYFLLAGIMDRFRYLRVGLAVVLVFVGFKMVVSDLYHIPIAVALGVVGGVILVSIIVSLAFRPATSSAQVYEEP